jgi:hypothetical protein
MSDVVMNQCKDFVRSAEFKKHIKEIMKPLMDYFLKECSIYLFFLVFFILSSFLLHLGILILLIRYNHNFARINI